MWRWTICPNIPHTFLLNEGHMTHCCERLDTALVSVPYILFQSVIFYFLVVLKHRPSCVLTQATGLGLCVLHAVAYNFAGLMCLFQCLHLLLCRPREPNKKSASSQYLISSLKRLKYHVIAFFFLIAQLYQQRLNCLSYKSIHWPKMF